MGWELECARVPGNTSAPAAWHKLEVRASWLLHVTLLDRPWMHLNAGSTESFGRHPELGGGSDLCARSTSSILAVAGMGRYG